ncbi:hypothetical protein [Nibricoccus sp. IMCC34717]|uniref:hypothetical protein n=1 Tax=Nibricoccus sp. IMCC34717 TaxID=3034021 RepID=UPI00384B5319
MVALSCASAARADLAGFLKNRGDKNYAVVEGSKSNSDLMHFKSAEMKDLSFKVLSNLESLRNLMGSYSGDFQLTNLQTNGGIEKATLAGSGKFSIRDASGLSLFGVIQSGLLQLTKSGNTASLSVQLNVSGLSYAGSNQGLLKLKGFGGGTFTLPLDYTALPSLASVVQSDGFHACAIQDGSYSPVSPIPESSTYALPFGAAALAVQVIRRRGPAVQPIS